MQDLKETLVMLDLWYVYLFIYFFNSADVIQEQFSRWCTCLV